MKHSALFLLAVAVLSGCSTVESIRTSIRDSQRPQEGAEALKHRKLFEAGRRAESRGDVKIAGDTYGWLIKVGNRYGEYGLAMLILRREPGSREAVKNLISCAKRSSHTSDMFPDSAMDSAFSIAALAKLADIAVSEHDRHDIAVSLRSMMSDLVTQEVRAWANEMKANSYSAVIYKDIIFAVESCRRDSGYVKSLKWSEINNVFVDSSAALSDDQTPPQKARAPSNSNPYLVEKFVKTQGAACKYDFEIRLVVDGTFEAAEKVRSAIRRQLVKEFLLANPHTGVDDVRISFLSWNQQNSVIMGTAAVMKVSAVRLEYDGLTHRGKIAVRLDGRDVPAARKWALENVGELATGKNVVLVAGKAPPPGASFSVGNERMTEDGLLEIEFKTE